MKAWFKTASGADWSTPDAVRADYRRSSFLEGNPVCFDIGGNKFRHIARINYLYRVVYIRFIGTHTDYDAIDANAV